AQPRPLARPRLEEVEAGLRLLLVPAVVEDPDAAVAALDLARHDRAAPVPQGGVLDHALGELDVAEAVDARPLVRVRIEGVLVLDRVDVDVEAVDLLEGARRQALDLD